MKDKNTLDLGTIDELEDRHDIPLAKVKKLMSDHPYQWRGYAAASG